MTLTGLLESKTGKHARLSNLKRCIACLSPTLILFSVTGKSRITRAAFSIYYTLCSFNSPILRIPRSSCGVGPVNGEIGPSSAQRLIWGYLPYAAMHANRHNEPARVLDRAATPSKSRTGPSAVRD